MHSIWSLSGLPTASSPYLPVRGAEQRGAHCLFSRSVCWGSGIQAPGSPLTSSADFPSEVTVLPPSPLPYISMLPCSASAFQVAVCSHVCLTLPGVSGPKGRASSTGGRLPGRLHLVVVDPTFCEPLAGADFALGYKGNSSSEKGETTTEVFLSQNRVSLDFWEPKSLSFKKLSPGLSRCCGPSLDPWLCRRQWGPTIGLPLPLLAAVAGLGPAGWGSWEGRNGPACLDLILRIQAASATPWIFLDIQIPPSRKPCLSPQNL